MSININKYFETEGAQHYINNGYWGDYFQYLDEEFNIQLISLKDVIKVMMNANLLDSRIELLVNYISGLYNIVEKYTRVYNKINPHMISKLGMPAIDFETLDIKIYELNDEDETDDLDAKLNTIENKLEEFLNYSLNWWKGTTSGVQISENKEIELLINLINNQIKSLPYICKVAKEIL